jgi:hypothetical protein
MTASQFLGSCLLGFREDYSYRKIVNRSNPLPSSLSEDRE